MERIFLGIVGVAYIALGGWCALRPEQTSKAVGYLLIPGSGQSEFLTVYGGIDLALGLAFLLPVLRATDLAYPLFLCLLVHACIVAFRTAGFVLYGGVATTTYILAATEWIILIAASLLYRRMG